MKTRQFATLDGNEAVARVAYRLNEVVAIYPITPSSPMAEWADAWSTMEQPNLWGSVPTIVQLQSEAGVAGALHGSLQAGAVTTTFTASQGLLLMLPNLYKIAGELSPTAIHIAARSVAAQALSIFGDHSDVMATRMTGCALLCSASVQEAHDLAAIATRATFDTRIPFLHFFDGFRTSHEVQKIELLKDEDLRALLDPSGMLAHRERALTPDRPVLRGTAQNPDVFFQARETVNPFYAHCPAKVQAAMDDFNRITSRCYKLFDYHGHPQAEQVVILMGSGCETVHETVDYLVAKGEKVGVIKVRLYRPWSAESFIASLPASVQTLAVLDRTKEPGSLGEPLYQDVVNTLVEQGRLDIRVVGGRYGLSSKEFTPAMVKAVFDNLAQAKPKNHFTVGIIDDVSHTSLTVDPEFTIEPDSVVRAIFYGLGSDGTVGANKNSIKIIGGNTDNYAQGYFVYDSKKSGSVTVSHLRFGPDPIRSTYLVEQANFVACHQWEFVDKYEVLSAAKQGATVLFNSPFSPVETWRRLPTQLQEIIQAKQLRVYGIDGAKVAREAGMKGRINTVMQVCFFALANVLPQEESIEQIKKSIHKTYGKKGKAVVEMNLQAVDRTLENLFEVPTGTQLEPATVGVVAAKSISKESGSTGVSDALSARFSTAMASAPAFVRDVLGPMMARHGDDLPVSALPCDGTYPTGTTQWEKRNVAAEIPVWDPDVCVQCGKCVMVCPHSVIRAKVYEPEQLASAPDSFKSTSARDRAWSDLQFTIQVAAEDCTGCAICIDVCPAKNKLEPKRKAINMEPQLPLREQERKNWDFFLELPNPDRQQLNLKKIGQQQLQEPLFEFSGACAGCGETPYIKLATQLFGDRMLVANATGCSSIYGGNLPTTPWSKNTNGRGPAWANSLFEDNAEFGLGFRIAIDQHIDQAIGLLTNLAASEASLLPTDLVQGLIGAAQMDEADIVEQRQRVEQLKTHLSQWRNQAEISPVVSRQLQSLESLADYLVKKSVWLIGGDGWAYDIGYGGLDHVMASGRNVNILVLDTEVYSNTGGQMSKATPRAAVAKFAAGGKPAPKKDLGLMAMTYGNVYVASVAMGARDEHTLRAFLEAESYEGPSLIIAYSHCIAHGIDMQKGLQQQKMAVDSGRWLLYRYDPRRSDLGDSPLMLDSRTPTLPVEATMYSENRFKMLARSNPDAAKQLLKDAQVDVDNRWQMYQYLAARPTQTQ
ncbi:pyruvate:ferredoxin (flavodoxin) oxidoreductase [Synechococcus sp. PCC 7335]|uniref:pyruvate:ferredoxin (flavodoxin) oxidoreductase n=1 Tax=Synechococcus sp. (strain ATCC 29403 / PCC 7335) TaxID=91464 RepID=UPI00017ECED8|nr:pyruvate:ferredoxin (flavodoxin) oxidoreductase [Synechococcus sp. PCC 7335]EDX83911.1 pyruvate:ferredoxin (flavodoxin) oxidoreductase [Synechococcus sp. PCC 7335]